MTGEAEKTKTSTNPKRLEELARQLSALKRSTFKTLMVYVASLLVALGCLFLLAFHSVIPPEPVREFDTAKENLFFEKYNSVVAEYKEAKTAPDIVEPGMIATVREFIRQLEMPWPVERIRREIASAGWNGGAGTGPQVFRIHLGVRNGWTTRRDPRYPDFLRFSLTSGMQLPIIPVTYTVGENKTLDEKVRNLVGAKPNERLSMGIGGNAGVLELLLDKQLTEERIAQFRSGVLQYANDLKSKLDQNEKGVAELESTMNKLRKDHDEVITGLVTAPATPERYGKIFSRISFSVVLITIALSLLYMINNEVILLAKLQSLLILGASLDFNVQSLSPFDAIDRLHVHGRSPYSANQLLKLAIEALRTGKSPGN